MEMQAGREGWNGRLEWKVGSEGWNGRLEWKDGDAGKEVCSNLVLSFWARERYRILCSWLHEINSFVHQRLFLWKTPVSGPDWQSV